MAHLKVKTARFGVDVEVDGQPVKELVGLDLKFPCDAVAEATLTVRLEKEFEYDGPASVTYVTTESVEQNARDLLERIGVPEAQSYTSGDLVELANLIRLARSKRR